ncbi:hypothetical protein SUGI_1113300 [Cryptomeria japonica]|nr:hypothetical protein SUGI_1113300 [Cryptomeria japonica]
MALRGILLRRKRARCSQVRLRKRRHSSGQSQRGLKRTAFRYITRRCQLGNNNPRDSRLFHNVIMMKIVK